MPDPHDALWQIGRLMLGRPCGLNPALIRQYALGWLVKAFFLPPRPGSRAALRPRAAANLQRLLRLGVFHSVLSQCRPGVDDLPHFAASNRHAHSLYRADCIRLAGRPRVLSTVLVVDWRPISRLRQRLRLGVRFAAIPYLYTLWGSAILALVAIYVWATIAFGARFSNLTHRGIITAGPYRFTKHPAYLAKNLSWWLITLPFDSWHGCRVLALWRGGVRRLQATFLPQSSPNRPTSRNAAQISR